MQQRDALIATLREEVRQLREQLDAANRKGQRQATPFARRKHIEHPKRPGRKKGQGQFSYRRKPLPTPARETKETPLPGCLVCGGPVRARKQHEQYVIDIPPVEPVITRYVTESGYWAHCRQRVRSRHPE